MKKKIEELSEKLRGKEKECEGLSSSVNGVKREMGNMKLDFQSRESAMEVEVMTLKAIITEKEKEIEKYKVQIAKLDGEQVNKNCETGLLSDEIKTLKVTIESLSNEIKNLREVSSDEKSKASLMIEDLEKQLLDKVNELEILRASNEEMISNLKNLHHSEIEGLRNEMNEVNLI